jgi:hypothetical protein
MLTFPANKPCSSYAIWGQTWPLLANAQITNKFIKIMGKKLYYIYKDIMAQDIVKHTLYLYSHCEICSIDTLAWNGYWTLHPKWEDTGPYKATSSAVCPVDFEAVWVKEHYKHFLPYKKIQILFLQLLRKKIEVQMFIDSEIVISHRKLCFRPKNLHQVL